MTAYVVYMSSRVKRVQYPILSPIIHMQGTVMEDKYPEKGLVLFFKTTIRPDHKCFCCTAGDERRRLPEASQKGASYGNINVTAWVYV